MLLVIDDFLDAATVAQFRAALEGAPWQAGLATAGTLGLHLKSNQQLDPDSALAIELGNTLLRRLGQHPQFCAAVLPERILPPRFNRYTAGGAYGTHVDSALMRMGAQLPTLRSDVSTTLFLSDPEQYDGGELLIETAFGAQAVKLPAGSLVLYPASSLHRVEPVTRGTRYAAFFWTQSVVRDEGERSVLYDLDQSVQQLTRALGTEHPEVLRLAGIYHNLLRRWALT